ncbi:rna-binding protein [Plasmopara halstedii]|uniref:Rna-binding protein n=1 Tax=Plasmopara halstedii TaxID=4781 RepID=A0A0N7L824_PLAHL|nr:rna-binding protein [Plasmopara halstedii]CEG48683.1 rna-binding protein [Plasmopara halstedii]|eukprot:XP_024585052.1 rna-binding protein [Plasmopara halstedii]
MLLDRRTNQYDEVVSSSKRLLMTMEFAPGNVPSTGSVYTDKEHTNDETSKLHLFRFGSSSDLFASMHYKDKEETGIASPTESTTTSKVESVCQNNHSDTLTASNQVTHDVKETTELHDLSDRAMETPVHTTLLSSRNTRRKNSIEMFLSQSPSQALGGNFLKLSLEDRQLNELHGPTCGTNDPTNVRTTRNANVYATGHFQLNAVTDDSLSGRYRAQSSARSHRDSVQQQLPPSLVRGTTVPTSSTGYSGTYMLHPSLDDSWSNQDFGTKVVYHEQMREFYGPTPLTPSYIPDVQYRPPTYRSSTGHGAYGYSPTPTRVQVVGHQWNSPIVNHQPPPPIYDHSTSMFLAPRANTMRHPMDIMSHHYGMRPPLGRTSGQNMYARMSPPLPEASPPHSPRKSMGMHVGMKHCKFFLQGHCRMGNKCKFIHQGNGSTPELVRTTSSILYPQRMMLPPPSHMMPPPRHHGDDMGQVPYSGRPQSRLNFRTDSSNGTGMNGTLMTSNTSILSACTTDSSTLSAALSVEDIQNRVFTMSKDQNGCRLLQEQLDYEDRTDLCEVIYHESLDHLAEMMVDPFGNYLFQKLLERVKETQRLVIIRRVSSNLVAAALNLHGTRSVQKVVEVCALSPNVIENDYHEEDCEEMRFASQGESETRRTTSLPDLIVEALKDDAVRLCIDSNGNHVIQRALQFMKPEYNQFVFDAVCQECTTVGTHRHGCCVLQRCLDAANKRQKTEVIEQVERQAMKLMQDPYGNYVVQYVLDSCTAEEAYGVILKPLGHIFELSIQKFSSNVIEKCLEKAPERVRQQYIAEITTCLKLNKMLQDQFANYVVQRALCVCAEDQCLLLVKAIRPHLAAMKNTSGGRRITARILKRFPTMDMGLDGGLFDGLYEPTTHSTMNHLSVTGTSYLPSQSFHGTGIDEMQQFQTRDTRMHSSEGNVRMVSEGLNATSRA